MTLGRARTLAKAADAISALTCQALRGIPAAFSPLIQQVRPHPGQQECAANLLRYLEGSRLLSEPGELRTQDPYSLRCIPQVHGASRDAFEWVKGVLEREINAATDNPLIFPAEAQVISGGNFHGQPLALALDFLAIALAELANISERRIERLVNPQLNDLPPFLTENGGLNSGLMIPQYVAAALVSENKVLCHPASVDSIPSSGNQEDHVSMGANAANKACQVADNVRDVLAIELLAACQAIDFRGPELLSPAGERLYRFVRTRVKFVDSDRPLYHDIRVLADSLESEEFEKLL
jgi:histidine ammonia-lyase